MWIDVLTFNGKKIEIFRFFEKMAKFFLTEDFGSAFWHWNLLCRNHDSKNLFKTSEQRGKQQKEFSNPLN